MGWKCLGNRSEVSVKVYYWIDDRVFRANLAYAWDLEGSIRMEEKFDVDAV